DEVLFGKLKNGGHVRVIVGKDEAGADELAFEFLDGPVTPRAEKLPEPRRAKAKRKSSSGARKPRSEPPKGGNGGGGARGTVPKVPLAKV
ncbi:MAG: ATP-dependent Clp protease ATP-binding subunit ClpA, partial [Rhizobiales bacterium]|nr:ATP-dependent Clp protease ATP-binding subunit ClpA [Hyphomicrobiales bacterium]